MHGRHRSPANRYRFGSEGSERKHGFRRSGNRFNRGFGRGHGHFRSFRSTEPSNEPSTHKGGDMLMKAGRLAAEHLVSKGMLSPDVLSGKWRNGSLKKWGQDFRELRGDGNGDGMQVHLEGKISAHSRLGVAGLDLGSDRRRYSEDYSPRRTRNDGEGSRGGGTIRGYGSDWCREYGRYSMSSDRSKDSTDGEDSSIVASGHNKDHRVKKGNENVTGKPGENEPALKTDGSECEIEMHDLVDEMTLKESSSGAEKDGLTETSCELGKDSSLLSENIQVIGGTASEELKEKAKEDLLFEHSGAEGSHSGNGCTNLLGFCNLVKVPTRSRSSLTSRISKDVPVSSSEDEHKSKTGLQVYDSAQASFGDTTSHMTHNSKTVESDVKKAIFIESSEDEKELGVAFGVDRSECMDSRPAPDTKPFTVQSAENAGNVDPSCGLEQGKCTRSQSFPLSKSPKYTEELTSAFVIKQSKCLRSNSISEKDFFHQDNQELSHESPSCATVQETTKKRTLEDSDTDRGTKQMREWLPPRTRRTDEPFNFSNRSEMIENSKGAGNPNENMLVMDDTQERLVHTSEFPMHGREEHFFPDLFKMYDVNVMDTSHANGSRHKDPNTLFPSISGTKKAIPMDIDFSMTSNIPGPYSRRLSNGKEIEVIDLEDDSAQEAKLVDYVEMTRETVFSDVTAYSNHTPGSGIITSVQDNCDGIMISEFLDSFQNCAPAPAENNLFPNEEETLGDYNSVNTSLDEIPLGFFPAWEQPPSSLDYDKHL